MIYLEPHLAARQSDGLLMNYQDATLGHLRSALLTLCSPLNLVWLRMSNVSLRDTGMVSLGKSTHVESTFDMI